MLRLSQASSSSEVRVLKNMDNANASERGLDFISPYVCLAGCSLFCSDSYTFYFTMLLFKLLTQEVNHLGLELT